MEPEIQGVNNIRDATEIQFLEFGFDRYFAVFCALCCCYFWQHWTTV